MNLWLSYERGLDVHSGSFYKSFEVLVGVLAFSRKYECQRARRFFKDILACRISSDWFDDPKGSFIALLRIDEIQLASMILELHGSALMHEYVTRKKSISFRWTDQEYWSYSDIESIPAPCYIAFVRAIEAEESRILFRPEGGRSSDICWTRVAAKFLKLQGL